MLAPAVRRFNAVDLNSQAGWIMQRLRARYPQKSEVTLANWMRATTNRNDCLFIRTDHAVALAEAVVLDLMEQHPWIFERFVWCQDRQNINHVDEGIVLYKELQRWAKPMGIERVIICQDSDVPVERIKREVFRKLSTIELTFARV